VITLDSPLRKVAGAKTEKALAKHLDLHTVEDLLYHFPRRYEERGKHTDIRSLKVGEPATVLAQVRKSSTRNIRNGTDKMAEVTVGDGSGGTLTLTYFGKKQIFHAGRLQPGRWGLFAGKVTLFGHHLQLVHPEYVLFGDEETAEEDIAEFASGLIPIYPIAGDVKTWNVTQTVRTALDMLTLPEDPLPATLRASHGLVDLGTALREIHRPESWATLGRAQRRLKWDEAFAVQVTLVQRKIRSAAWPARPRPRQSGGLLDAFDAGLPYELTKGQRRVGEEISADLDTAHPMHRLLQGEVGSGKTLCAVRAMLQVVDAGGQAAMLAPTEVLTAQHYRNILDLLGPMGRAPPGSRCSPARSGRPPAAARRRRSRPARRASWWARTPCCTRASSSTTSAWWSSTSSTGSGWSSGTRCAPRPTSRRTYW
jgi:ATP-dependent DNA helicase RecG